MIRRTLPLILFFIAVHVHAYAGNNPYFKMAIHVEPHQAGRVCDSGLPAIQGCGDINYSHGGCGEVEAFPVFYDLTELAGIQHGLTWPESWGSCIFTPCAGDFYRGEIVHPGDGISCTWEGCQAVSVIVTGYGSLTADTPGEIRIVANPSSSLLSATDCHFMDSPPAQTFYAGVCGVDGENPCSGTVSTVPATWGQIKSMFR